MDARVEEEEEVIRIKYLTFNKRQAIRLVQVLRAAADKEPLREDRDKFRDIARRLTEKSGGPYVWKRRIKRPRDDDEIAVQRVLAGDRPYPVLSPADARCVFMHMDARGASAREIANRLYCDQATITRWRRERRQGKWEGKYE